MSNRYNPKVAKLYQPIPVKNEVRSVDDRGGHGVRVIYNPRAVYVDALIKRLNTKIDLPSPVSDEVLFEDTSHDIVVDGVSYTVKGKRIKNGIKQ